MGVTKELQLISVVSFSSNYDLQRNKNIMRAMQEEHIHHLKPETWATKKFASFYVP